MERRFPLIASSKTPQSHSLRTTSQHSTFTITHFQKYKSQSGDQLSIIVSMTLLLTGSLRQPSRQLLRFSLLDVLLTMQ